MEPRRQLQKRVRAEKKDAVLPRYSREVRSQAVEECRQAMADGESMASFAAATGVSASFCEEGGAFLVGAFLVGLPDHDFIPGEVMARFPLELDDNEVGLIAWSAGALRVTRKSPLGLFLVHGPPSVAATRRLMEKLWDTHTAVSIGANYVGELTFVPNDPHHSNGNQWYHEAPSDIDLDLTSAWDITRGSSSVVVAQVDTGVDVDHPEFAGRFYVNPGEVPGNLIDDDNNGYVDDVSGWNAVDDNGNVNDTTIGHGTWVASILLANTNNSYQIASFDHFARLLPLKALDGQFGSLTDLVAALDYLVCNPGIAPIVNMSVAGYQQFSNLATALATVAQDSILIGGAGNDFQFVGPGGADSGYPEAHPVVITIAGTDQFDARAPSSDTGNSVEFSAPAVDIYTASWQDPNNPAAFHVGPGTSFSTPMVSGIASLGLAIRPTMTRSELIYALQQSAVDLGAPGWDPEFGWGRVNAQVAIETLQNWIFSDGFESGDTIAWDSVSP